MDKDLLRIVIIATGAVVFLLVLLWGVLRSRKSKQGMGFRSGKNALHHRIDDSLVVNMNEDEFDIVPLGSDTNRENRSAGDDETLFDISDTLTGSDTLKAEDNGSIPQNTEKHAVSSAEAKPEMPDLIQFILLAGNENGFNGVELVNALKGVGLVYGDLKIFERLDDQKRVNYGIANLVNPGTFPETDLHLFSCPGITFFMQPKVLDDPLAVFNELVALIYLLSRQLNGEILDSQRQPLTDQTIASLRKSLSA